jgi:hypothetical protein
MVDAQSISIIFAGLSIGIAAIYYTLTLRNSQKAQQLQLETRQSQLFMQLFQHYIDKEQWIQRWKLTEMEWDDYDEFTRKYDSSVNIENFAMRYNNWYFWDGMGLLLKKNLVDREMIYYLLGGGFGVLFSWDKFQSIIKQMRVQLDLPEMFVWFEYLADEMKKVAIEKGNPWKPVVDGGALIREET